MRYCEKLFKHGLDRPEAEEFSYCWAVPAAKNCAKMLKAGQKGGVESAALEADLIRGMTTSVFCKGCAGS